MLSSQGQFLFYKGNDTTAVLARESSIKYSAASYWHSMSTHGDSITPRGRKSESKITNTKCLQKGQNWQKTGKDETQRYPFYLCRN
jgi:hypothetical protein